MFENYQKQKSALLKQYSKISNKSGFLPIEIDSKKITKKDIQKKIQNLEDEHFKVSITGQIKAGKSTLINALIFKDQIVPADDTPHTAKITLIKYAKTSAIEVEFYNTKEWGELQNSDIFDQYLKSDVEYSIQKGIYEKEVILSTSCIKKDSIDNLKEYVSKNGKYTPFVNIVTIYYPNDILKELTVVDTPGTNDPNKLRDKVAKEWIHQTDANIYISYAGQAMNHQDYKFIDEFLLSVPKEQKITVLNKIDTLNEDDNLDSYIDELFNDKELIKKEILSSKDNLIQISSLGALIDGMLEDKKDLNSDLEYYAEQLDERGYLESNKHNLPKLKEMIEKKLIKLKGDNIISSHKKFILSCFKDKEKLLNDKLTNIKFTLESLLKDTRELQKEELEIKKINEDFNNKFEKITEEFSIYLKNKFEEFRDDINNFKTKCSKTIQRKIKDIEQTNLFKNEVLWIIKSVLDDSSFQDNITQLRDELTNFAKNKVTDLQSEIIKKNSGISTISYYNFDFYANNLVDDMKELADKSFSKKELTYIVYENTSFFQRCFDTKKGLDNIYSALYDNVEKYLEYVLSNTEKTLKVKIDEQVQTKYLKSLQNDINKELAEKKKKLNDILKNQDDKKEQIKKSTTQKENVKQEIKELNQYKKEIM